LKIQECKTKNGNNNCPVGKCIFAKDISGKVSVIAIYVDELIIARNSEAGVNSIFAFLRKLFSIKE
jgi:hypothetical protein